MRKISFHDIFRKDDILFDENEIILICQLTLQKSK
jgi:hypothetical protein